MPRDFFLRCKFKLDLKKKKKKKNSKKKKKKKKRLKTGILGCIQMGIKCELFFLPLS